jgi:Flp pilus assembly protein TadG
MNEIIGAVLHPIAKFRRNASGNVAIIFALSLIPVISMVGAGVDYSRASNVRSRLQAAADAAAVGAIAKASTAYTTALTMTVDGPIPAGNTQAINIFNADISGKTGFTVTSLSTDVERAGQQVNATVSFTATVPTDFMQIMGISTMTVTGTAVAANNMPTYIDFYLLLDNTPSMGVGATTNDIATMVNNTSDQCAFACHDLSNSNNYYKLAKSLGVTMRIDVVRSAVQQLMTNATNQETMPNQFRMAIYTFGSSASTAGLSKISSLTSNLSTSASDAGNIDLMTVQGQNQNNDMDTNYDSVLTAMNKEIPNPGTGQTNSAPQKVFFFVTDGVADEANTSCLKSTTDGTRCQEPLNTALCDTMKKRGIMIVVLYTTYLPLPTNPWYNQWVAPFQGSIATNMQTCASPGSGGTPMYQAVGPNDSISQTMNQLFTDAVKQARLTQ